MKNGQTNQEDNRMKPHHTSPTATWKGYHYRAEVAKLETH